MIRIGTAGWTIPRPVAESFPGSGHHLERYSRVMRCAEINSSFHRPHRPSTYARWAAETPPDFRFTAKLPRTVTHGAKLVDVDALLDTFMVEVAGLGDRLAVLLVQLPPSFGFEADVVDAFFAALRARHPGAIVCEPRHLSWLEPDADALLVAHRVGRAAADPARSDAAARPGGWLGSDGSGADAVVYYRWHGAPRVYWSPYDDDWLAARAAEVVRWPDRSDVWCMFDNTASGAALGNALRFSAMVAGLQTC